MNTLALFLGFMIGAAIGTVATASTADELQSEAKRWLFKRRWQIYLRRRTWQFPFVLTRILRLLQIEILVIFICIWVFGLLWTIFLSPAWYEKSYTPYIIGSLVGVATAPWIWLHFSRHLSPDDADDTQFARYKFMTFMLGAALLLTMLQPHLGSWLTRANKIEVAGLASFNFAPAGNERGAKVLQTGQQAGGALGATTSRLATATTLAHLVTTGHKEGKPWKEQIKLQDVGPDMKGFDGLSVMDRDKVYIAYFYHQRSAELGNHSFLEKPANLYQYVERANVNLVKGPDEAFLAGLADLSRCIALYAENLRDFRLFLVDSGPFLRTLLVNVAAKWIKRDEDTPAPPRTAAPATSESMELNVAALLAGEVSQALQKTRLIDEKVCPGSTGGTLNPTNPLTQRNLDVKDIGTTPYPAYLIAHYLAAIDSVESGVLVLRDWLFYQRDKSASFKADSRSKTGTPFAPCSLQASCHTDLGACLQPTGHRCSSNRKPPTASQRCSEFGAHNRGVPCASGWTETDCTLV
jgi:hypothetical protein